MPRRKSKKPTSARPSGSKKVTGASSKGRAAKSASKQRTHRRADKPEGAAREMAAADWALGAALPVPPEPDEKVAITLRTKDGIAFTLHSSKQLQRAAIQWTYVLRNRRRWVAQESLRAEQSRRARELFDELGVGEDELRHLAESDVVEVSVPFVRETTGWEARIFPWEYMVTAVTREYRGQRPMTVVRHLDRAVAPEPSTVPHSVLFVESAPDILSEYFTFEGERALVKTNLGLSKYEELTNPTAEALQKKIIDFEPDVLHLAGVDSHQGAVLLKTPGAESDGYVMAGERSAVEYVEAERLASILCAARRRPALVSFSFFNSGARLAALAVAEGADVAIGFQDEFEDALVEFFFMSFYHTWKLSEGNTLEAFRLTCNTLREQGGLYGTGVILWSARSLVAQPPTAPSRRRGRHTVAEPALPVATAEIEERVRNEKEKEKYIEPEDVPPNKVAEILQVNIKPYESLNYSMLHNNRPLFREFRITKPGPDRVRGIEVKVVLWAGPTSFPYEQTLEIIDRKPADLSDKVRVPLIYSMGLAASESVHTSIYVSITWGHHKLYSNTHRVTLLPLDEWRDDDNDRVWLPSFVLPRDRSVNRIVDAGQRYLWALADDSGAGFDGYQSVETDQQTGTLHTDGVDLQVQALWAALAFEMNLGYINPPPSYNLSSQRVRTPSEVIEGHRGTCIDLALLLATCCEYIDVYPVIFLLEGHAFPGYWRSDAYHQAFIGMANVANAATPACADAAPTGSPQPQTGTGQRFPWYLDKSFYGEVVQQVRDLKLVPIESTLIPRRGSFWEAVDAGIENLRSKRQFHSLIDVRLARDNRPPVTPIPLRGRPE